MSSTINNTKRLALGSAQFGLPYGIANQRGMIGQDEARRILMNAREHGIDLLDTAIAYGDSEASLGALGISSWRVVTKLPATHEAYTDISAWVSQQIHESLSRLRINRLYGLLLHRPEQLQSACGKELYQALCSLKSQGLVEKIGISIYTPDELDALYKHFSFDLIQAPFNVLDRRMIDTGWLARLHGQGIEVHVRSVFLQGLLLMPSANRPLPFARWQPLWDRWDHWLAEHQLTPVQACLQHALSFPEITQIVVGVDSMAQLQEILMNAEGVLPPLPPLLRTNDIDLLNPARWDRL